MKPRTVRFSWSAEEGELLPLTERLLTSATTEAPAFLLLAILAAAAEEEEVPAPVSEDAAEAGVDTTGRVN